eukprot:TRINITY_DN6365_c0_g1_i1.p1 TRINITY_DN6365_c0_g1~~TRINITY_DN6365_c0_g1_i1.p1  ORF type:complete len:916 (+),score=131.01 TRINITY_DN6365_c0_g1_i1:44-2791(+)
MSIRPFGRNSSGAGPETAKPALHSISVVPMPATDAFVSSNGVKDLLSNAIRKSRSRPEQLAQDVQSNSGHSVLRSTANISKGGLSATRTDISLSESVSLSRFRSRFVDHPVLESEFWKDYYDRYRSLHILVARFFCVAAALNFLLYYSTYDNKVDHGELKRSELLLAMGLFLLPSTLLGLLTLSKYAQSKYLIMMFNISLAAILVGVIFIDASISATRSEMEMLGKGRCTGSAILVNQTLDNPSSNIDHGSHHKDLDAHDHHMAAESNITIACGSPIFVCGAALITEGNVTNGIVHVQIKSTDLAVQFFGFISFGNSVLSNGTFELIQKGTTLSSNNLTIQSHQSTTHCKQVAILCQRPLVSEGHDQNYAFHVIKDRDSYAFSLLIVSILFGVANPLFQIPYVHMIVHALLVIVVHLAAVFSYETYATELRAFTFTALLFLMAVTMIYGACRAERAMRRNFLFEKDLNRRNEHLKTRLEKLNSTKQKPVDLDSPIERALQIVHKWRDTPELCNLAGPEVETMLAILTNPNIFNPDFKKQVKEGDSTVDKEVKDWIMYEFAHSSQAPTATRTVSFGSLGDTGKIPTFLSSPMISSSLEKAEAIVNRVEWNADVFGLHETTQGHSLAFLVNHLLRRHNLVSRYKIPETCLSNFLRELDKGYDDNPFHNQIHVADVTMNINYLLHRPSVAESMTDLDKLAAILAAAAHDFRHPGYNNLYHINMEMDLAMTYNDHSVLENFHISEVFKLLGDSKKECNILAGLSRAERKEVRESMIEMVLATDLSLHFTFLNQFKSQVQSDFDLSKRPCKLTLLRMMMKCADIAHTTKSLELHRNWTLRVANEFFNQGDREKANNIPVSPFMDRSVPNIANSQLGFLEFVCKPLFEAWAQACVDDIEMVNQLSRNHSYWKSRRDEGYTD